MDIKQNPFSLYDFLGYFTPGAIFLYGAFAVVGHVMPDKTPTSYITEILSFDKKSEMYVLYSIRPFSVNPCLYLPNRNSFARTT